MGRISLIGMMGSGKTTVAPLVATRLGWRVLDTDGEVSAAGGYPIAELLRRDLAAFRAAESAVVAAAAAAPEDLVVACGGGVVLAPASVAAMRASGMVVLLDARHALVLGANVPPVGPDLQAPVRSIGEARPEPDGGHVLLAGQDLARSSGEDAGKAAVEDLVLAKEVHAPPVRVVAGLEDVDGL